LRDLPQVGGHGISAVFRDNGRPSRYGLECVPEIRSGSRRLTGGLVVSVLTAYSRFRFLWGAVDWEGGSESPYTTAQTGATLGTSAAPGVGVGVRRCVLTFDRTAEIAGADDAECHFDFLNITGGDPDDTWTPTDYTTLEGYLDTWYGSVKSRLTQYQTLSGYRWYRHGPGINPPNPAERVTTRSVAGTSTADALPPQCASTLSPTPSPRSTRARTATTSLWSWSPSTSAPCWPSKRWRWTR
jgi:hypothetical protein